MKISTPLAVALCAGILASNGIEARNLKGKSEDTEPVLHGLCESADGVYVPGKSKYEGAGTCFLSGSGEVSESTLIIVGTNDQKNDALGELQLQCADDETLVGCYSYYQPNMDRFDEYTRGSVPIGEPEDREGTYDMYHGIFSQVEHIDAKKGSCKSRLFDERGRENLPDEPNPNFPPMEVTSGTHYLFGTCAKFNNYTKEDSQTEIQEGEWEVKQSSVSCPADMTAVACYGTVEDEGDHIVQSDLSATKTKCTSTLAGNLTGFENLKVKSSALCFKHEHLETTVVQVSNDLVSKDWQADFNFDRYEVSFSPDADGEFLFATKCSCTGEGCWGAGFSWPLAQSMPTPNTCMGFSECPTCFGTADVRANPITATNLKFQPKK